MAIFSVWRQEISLISGVKVRQLQQFAVTFELHFYQHRLLEWLGGMVFYSSFCRKTCVRFFATFNSNFLDQKSRFMRGRQKVQQDSDKIMSFFYDSDVNFFFETLG